MHIVLRNAIVAFSLSIFVSTLPAQIQNARIEGIVQDSSGAVIPGAKLYIVNNKTDLKSEAEANAKAMRE